MVKIDLFNVHEKSQKTRLELNKLYMNKWNSQSLGYSFLSHSRLGPSGSHGWEGTSGMFPSSRTGTGSEIRSFNM